MHKKIHVILTASGFGTLFFGLIGAWFLFPKILDSQIHANIDLKEGTMGYDTWKKQPFPLKFKVYLFNVTNAAEVQSGAKPKVKEIGPYVYDQYRERLNIKLNETKDVYRYILKKHYFFNKEESGCHDPDDVVTIINAALVGTALQVQAILPSAVSLVNEAVPYLFPGTKDIFLTAKVRDILFEGIPIRCQDEEVEVICTAMKGALPKTIQPAANGQDFLFSMFRHLNGTDDGPWEMERGIKNSTRGEIFSFEGKEVLDIWEKGSTCNMINGSDSSVFEIPPKQRQERINTFSQDFCRSVYIEYEKEDSEFDIPTLRYSNVKKGAFDYDSGEMKCFCPFVEDDEGEEHQVCPMNGIADITPCMKAPVLVSFPHFLLGDPKLREYVQGLNPQKDLHEIYVNLEPITATPLSGHKRVQMNILVKKIEEFDLLENVTEGVFPIVWIDEGVTLPDDFVEILKSSFMKIGILNSMKWVLIVGGFGTFIAGLVMTMQKEKMLCFSKNDTVDITNLKPMNLDNSRHETGINNLNCESNASLNLQAGNPPINKSVNRQTNRNLAMQQWNSQVWHTGETS